MLTHGYPCVDGLTNIMLCDFGMSKWCFTIDLHQAKGGQDYGRKGSAWTFDWKHEEREEKEICLHPCPLVVFSYHVL